MSHNPTTKRGLFVSVDGPNGAGKSSLVTVLKECLIKNGLKVHLTKEVTATPLGGFIRETHKQYHGKTLAYLLAADRQNHLEADVLPALENHDIVITDRYVGSSLVYQRMDGVELSFLWNLNKEFLKPGLSIIVFASPAVIRNRLAERSSLDRFESNFSREDEVNLFMEAATFMEEHGLRVSRFKNETLSVEEGAKHLADQVLLVKSQNG